MKLHYFNTLRVAFEIENVQGFDINVTPEQKRMFSTIPGKIEVIIRAEKWIKTCIITAHSCAKFDEFLLSIVKELKEVFCPEQYAAEQEAERVLKEQNMKVMLAGFAGPGSMDIDGEAGEK